MARSSELTGSAGAIKTLFDAIIRHGVPVATIEQLTGISYSDLKDPDARIGLQRIIKLARQISALTQTQSIGLKLGSTTDMIYPSAIGWGIMLNSRTIGEGLRQLVRFTRIMSEFLTVELQEEESITKVIVLIDPLDYYTEFSIELVLSRILTSLRTVLGSAFNPVAAGFHHKAPSYSQEYQALFRSPLHFDCPVSYLAVDSKVMSQPIPNRNEYLAGMLTRHAEKLLQELSTPKLFGDQVKELVLKYIYTGQVDVELIAEHLQVSRFTLYRKLKQEGSSFKQLLSELRLELAKSYLKQQSLSIHEIAFLLGFSEPSAFNRSFKRALGETPKEFQRRGSKILEG